ncbi:hypothetical protein KAR91_04615 [Candidatus Pacearchaeota archaeon]|nr:hypothetical protein [Candidatus Pacearchaeota archaeon]
MRNKKVACVDCENYYWEPIGLLTNANHISNRCKIGAKKFNPIYGYEIAVASCKSKNRDGYCKDFQKAAPWQEKQIEEEIMPELFPLNMSCCTKHLEPGEIFICNNGMKITTEFEPKKPWWKGMR